MHEGRGPAWRKCFTGNSVPGGLLWRVLETSAAAVRLAAVHCMEDTPGELTLWPDGQQDDPRETSLPSKVGLWVSKMYPQGRVSL